MSVVRSVNLQKQRAFHIASVCYSFIVIIYRFYIVSTTSSIPSLLSRRRHRHRGCCRAILHYYFLEFVRSNDTSYHDNYDHLM